MSPIKTEVIMNSFKLNREKLYKDIPNDSLMIVFGGTAQHKSADAFYKYWADRDFYYLTGMSEPDLIFTAVKINDKVRENLWIIKRDIQQVRWIGDVIHKDEASSVSGIDNIGYINDFQSFISMVLLNQNIDMLFTGYPRRNLKMGASISEIYTNDIKNKYPYLQLKSLSPYIHRLRMKKEKYEIEATRKAIDITKEGIFAILKNLQPGATENSMEAYFDFELKKHGVDWHAFQTIAASGKNAATLHYEENKDKLNDGDLILFDLGAQWEFYNADISRTFPIGGSFSSEQAKLYSIVLEANKKVIESVKPGLPFDSLQTICKDVLSTGLQSIGLISSEKDLFEYYFHGVSHFLGLDTHDVGERNCTLQPGMLFTVEPGLYFRDKGLGIRIEDDVLVTDTGCEVLSKDIPKEIHEIEDLMKSYRN